MATMNRPTFQAIRQHSPTKPALVFVSSRRQTRLTALDLIAYLAADDDPKQWLHMSEEEMEQIVAGVKDSNLKLTLAFGIGMHHAGLQERDRKTTEELFVHQKIQVCTCSESHSWVAPENVGLQKEQKCSTFACHTCNEVRLCVLRIRKKEVGNTKR
jgi:activating signal cointegrator complex subunit 3